MGNWRGRVALGITILATGISAAQGQEDLLVYSIDVTAPGSKSQGVRGTLYDSGGREVTQLEPVDTPIGQFRWISCQRLWDSCGWWRVGPERAGSTHRTANPDLLSYRVYRRELPSGTSWRGELVGSGSVAVQRAEIVTPMGTFRWTTGRIGQAQWQGWVPASWPDLPFAGPPTHR